METIVHYEDGWTVKELTEAIQFIENKRNVNVYLMPKDHEKEYERLQIHAIGIETEESLDIFVEREE